MKALSADGLERRVVDFLREQWPDRLAAFPAGDVAALIRRAMAPASGMGTEREIARYVLFGLVTHPAFDSNPAFSWAWPTLHDPSRQGEARLDRLFALARRRGYTVGAARMGG